VRLGEKGLRREKAQARKARKAEGIELEVGGAAVDRLRP